MRAPSPPDLHCRRYYFVALLLVTLTTLNGRSGFIAERSAAAPRCAPTQTPTSEPHYDCTLKITW